MTDATKGAAARMSVQAGELGTTPCMHLACCSKKALARACVRPCRPVTAPKAGRLTETWAPV